MMITVNALSEVAALMGDPARAAMLSLLMDGRAHTASDLALSAGITAQTASGHLGRMTEADLLAARAQGRNRFYRLASGDVAHAIESLMAQASTRHFARQCLDWSERRPHISGALGSAIADTFFKKGWAEKLRRGRTVRLTDSGRRALARDFGAAV